MTNVILVDDHELFRLGIRGSLRQTDVHIIGEPTAANDSSNC